MTVLRLLLDFNSSIVESLWIFLLSKIRQYSSRLQLGRPVYLGLDA
jgi:hypothetical protein